MNYQEILEGYEPEFDYNGRDYISQKTDKTIEHKLTFYKVVNEDLELAEADPESGAYRSLWYHFDNYMEVETYNTVTTDMDCDSNELTVVFTVTEFI